MKKVLSIALALVMALSTMVMLVPTASASGMTHAPVNEAESWVYYEQNFDDPSLASKTDAALASALGFSAPGATNTMMMQDGQLRIVSQYTKTGEFPPTVTSNNWAGGYSTTLVTDARMATSTTVMEYDLTYQRRAGGAENDIVVNANKTVKADGQGTYQMAFLGFAATNQSGTFYSRVNLSGDIAWNNNLDITPTGGTRTWGGKTLRSINPMPKTETMTGFEYSNDPETAPTGKYTSTVIDMKLHIKYVLNPSSGNIMMYVNDSLVAVTYDGYQGDISRWAQSMTDGRVFLQSNCGIDALIDNIKIWGYDETPNLVVSEIAINGQGTSSTEGSYTTGTYEDYQWVEVYNPTTKDVNVYDYSLVVDTAPFSGNSGAGLGTIGQEQELGTSSYHKTDKYSSIGYLRSGDQTFTAANSTEYTFTNPAYEEGVLKAGETALFLMPSTALRGNLAIDNETVEAYFASKGTPEGTKIFVCDNKSEKPFEFTLDQGNVVGIMAVNNADTDNVEAIGYGQRTFNTWYYESYCIVTAKGGGSGSVFLGFSVKTALGELPNLAACTTKNASFEISYFDWAADGSTSRMGFMKYNATATRTGIDGTPVSMTPGFVPVDCRRPIGKIEAVNGTIDTTLQRFNTETKLTATAPAEEVGSRIDLYVNGVLYTEDVPAETAIQVTVPASTTLGTATLEFRYTVVAPTIIGIQQSDTNTVRILAGVNDLDLENDTLGFNVLVNYAEQESLVEYNCKYVYKSVTVSGQNTSAESLGYEHLFVLHITDVPFDELTNELTITVEASMNGESGVMGSQQFVFPAA